MAQLFWNASHLWPLALVAGGLVLLGAFWMYPPQLKGLPRAWQIILPVMRSLAVIAVVFSLLKPTLVRPRTQEEHGAVVVLVDNSASMGVADAQMPITRKVALADALGELPEGRRTRIAPTLVTNIKNLRRSLESATRAINDLAYARLTGRQIGRREQEFETVFGEATKLTSSVEAEVVAEKMQGALGDRLRLLSQRPVGEARRAWLLDVMAVLPRIEQELERRQIQSDDALYAADAEVRTRADAISRESRMRLVEKAITGPRGGLLAQLPPEIPLYGYAIAADAKPLPLRSGTQSVKRLLVEPTGELSRIATSISQVAEQFGNQPVRGIVLFSDGRSTSEGAGTRLTMGNIPVFCVCTGTEHAFKDVAIVNVEMPASAYAGEVVAPKVTLRETGMPNAQQNLTMKFGKQVQATQVKFGNDHLAHAEFSFVPEEAGVSSVQVDAAPSEGEASTQNNSATRYLKVVQDRLNVLVATTDATWDYQYVRNALLRAKWARLTDAVAKEGLLPLTPEAILQQNVIVLFAMPAGALTPQQIDAIHRAVTERGSSVILVAGGGFDVDGFAQNPLLGELLPWRAGGRPVWRSWPGDRPVFRMTPSAGSRASEALKLAEDPHESETRWANLPAVYHYMALPQLKPNVINTLLVEKESQVPVLVESRLGIGRIFFFGIEESWRWRMRVGERDQDRFWLQLVRYSAEEPYAVVSDKLAMDLDRVDVRPGGEVRVRCRVATTASAAAMQKPVIELQQGGKLLRVESPSADEIAQPGRYQAILRDLPEGSFDVVVKLDNATSLKLPLRVGFGLTDELANVAADPAALQQISSATGGQFLELEDVRELGKVLAELKHRSGTFLELPIWDSAYLFIFVLACLAVEWAVRKRAGLA